MKHKTKPLRSPVYSLSKLIKNYSHSYLLIVVFFEIKKPPV
ncbi:protein of unknown function [Brochothrix thermosphacta]|uniref:Uncharacterized protein n=1 Tax=Brochothrix thermosphacta TaxID=2756 RepID=A0A2X0R3Z9_BROTH|nr:hypothetical protein FM106_02085 [Brachybacterium faecium]SPN71988.1 protein of unknown function [Brochothrix thermosphacta]SPN76086.1 hypothetical protein BTEBP_50033 [Brochothrix thermosphacta]SPP28810.1 hypothetical protein BTBSAS_30128 [Brochothrix thermosphacta]